MDYTTKPVEDSIGIINSYLESFKKCNLVYI